MCNKGIIHLFETYTPHHILMQETLSERPCYTENTINCLFCDLCPKELSFGKTIKVKTNIKQINTLIKNKVTVLPPF